MHLLFLFLWGAVGVAHMYAYHPKLSAYLGAGFSVEDPEASFLECVTYDSEELLDGKGVYKTEISVNAIQSQKELLSELGVSASLSAASHFVSGSIGMSYLESYQFEENSLTWMLSAKADFGRVALEGVKLDTAAQSLLDAGKYLEFEKRCGTHFVSKERRGASIFAIYSLHNLSAIEKKKFEAYLEASASHGVLTAEAEASFTKLLSEATKTNSLDLHIFTLGGEGLKQFSNLPQNLTDLEKIKEILGNYLKSLDLAYSVPLEYHVTSMEVFGFKQDKTSDFKRRDLILEKLYFVLQDKEKTSKRLFHILNQWKALYPFLTKEELQTYRTHYQAVSKEIDELYLQASLCLDSTVNCKQPSWLDSAVDVEWPDALSEDDLEKLSRIHVEDPEPLTPVGKRISQKRCTILRKEAFLKWCITKAELYILQKLNAAPFCDDENQFFTWIGCGKE